jgi:uncharacterized protein
MVALENRSMLYLHDLKRQGQHSVALVLEERLPGYVLGPCHLSVRYQIAPGSDYYLLHLSVAGPLRLLCQRCMGEFGFSYENTTVVAVCQNEDRANELLSQYECIVSADGQVALNDLVIDELHLYAPQYHENLQACQPIDQA